MLYFLYLVNDCAGRTEENWPSVFNAEFTLSDLLKKWYHTNQIIIKYRILLYYSYIAN